MNTIKQIANSLHIQASAIRYYEKMGLITFQRDENGYRRCSDDDLQQLKLILIMKYSGYTIDEIKEVVQMQTSDITSSCEEETTKSILKKREEILLKIENYKRIVELSDYLLPQAYKFTDDDTNGELKELIDDVYEKIQRE